MNISEKIKMLLDEEQKKKKAKEKEVEVVNVKLNNSDMGGGEEVVKLTSSSTNNDDRAKLLNTIDMYKKEQERIQNIPDVTFEEKTYVPKTDEEIKKEVEGEISDFYNLKEQSLKDKKQSVIDNYNDVKSDKEQIAKDKKTQIDALYNELNEKISNNAIKRGLQRSSIVSEQLKDSNAMKISDFLKVDENLKNDLSKIEEEVVKAQNDYASAVSELNFKKALEMNEKVEKLKAEEEKKLKEILEYNEKSKEDAIKANDILNKQKSDEIISYKGKIVGEVLKYFYALPHGERYDAFVADTELQNLLGDYAEYIGRFLKNS